MQHTQIIESCLWTITISFFSNCSFLNGGKNIKFFSLLFVSFLLILMFAFVSCGARHRSSHFINSSSFHPAQSSGPFLAFISTICSFFSSSASPLYSRRGSHLALTPAHPSRPPPAFHSPGLAFHQSLPSSRPPPASPLPPFQPFSLSTFI